MKFKDYKIPLLIILLLFAIFRVYKDNRLDDSSDDAYQERNKSNTNTIDSDPVKRLNNPVVGETINEKSAMLFLFPNFNGKEMMAEWKPSVNSDIFRFLYHKRKMSELRTKPAYNAFFNDSGQKYFILIIQTAFVFDSCHACTVVLGGALFHQIGKVWKLETFNHSIMAAGSYGNAPHDMRLVKIGQNRYGVAIIDGYMGQGVYSENYYLIGPVGNRLEKLLSIDDTAGNNEGACDDGSDNSIASKCYYYESSIEFNQGNNTDYFDVMLVKEGTRSVSFDTVSNFKKVGQYQFNGCCYKKVTETGKEYRKFPYFIQIASFERFQAASGMTDKLDMLGYNSYCSFHKGKDGRSYFRVRVGNYVTKEEATRDLEKLSETGVNGFVAR